MTAPGAPRRTNLLRSDDGPLSRELVRQPGGFGLGQVPSKVAPDAVTSMVCGFCSTGCSLDIHLRDGQAVNLTPTPGHTVNRGVACPKGWEALTPLQAGDRATTPLLRGDDGRVRPIDWPTALDTFTRRFKAIRDTHGPQSMAFLGTGQMPSEELALLGAVARFGMGFAHGDGNTRQCMATSVVAHKECFGFDAPPFTYADFEESDVIVLIGSNLCVTHPIMWERITRNPHHPQVIVIDPRRTETAMAATQHYPLRPSSDLWLLYGLARILIERGWIDTSYIADHTSGFEAYAEHVASFTPAVVSRETGLDESELQRLATAIGTGQRVSLWWTMGINQGHEAVRSAQAIIAIALMTGNIGRPGTGANSITGQCNAMGSRLFSNTASLFGGRDFANPAYRADVASILGLDQALIPSETGRAYDQIVSGIEDGTIKGLWVVATNGAHSWIHQSAIRDALAKLEFLVVQDMFTSTDTAILADLVLPAAGWGEKDGTFINSERRIALIKKVSRAPGVALADFAIFKLLADAWGCGELFSQWDTPEDVFSLLRELSAGRPCDITGIDGYDMLDEQGGVQWPWPAAGSPSDTPSEPVAERRLFEDGQFFHPDQRGRFVCDQPQPVPEPAGGDFPLLLLTGRGCASQWHTLTRTGKSALLRSLSPDAAYVEINPSDAAARGVQDNDWAVVASPRASVLARAFVTPTVQEGQVFVPMHDVDTNLLTAPVVDPHSRQPAYKQGAVQIRKAKAFERPRPL